MTYAFVVPIRNTPELTEHFLARIGPLLGDDDASLVLVSDCDDSIANRRLIRLATKTLPRTKSIFLNEWAGYGVAANRGADETDAEYIVFINSDTFPLMGSARKLVETLALNSRVGVAQGLLLHPQTMLVQSAGHIFGHFYNRHALLGRRADEEIVQCGGDRQALTSAFYAVRREQFLQQGRFDDWYWNSHEGMEFALKLHLNGYSCRYVPQAVAYHVQGSGRGRDRIDEKQQVARFWGRWAAFIKPDVVELLAVQMPSRLAQRYLRIDLGVNRSWNSVLEKLPICHELVATHYSTERHLVFEEVLSPRIAKLPGPLLYLTDHFGQIARNRLWLNERKGEGDLVADCHGNLLSADNI